MRAIQFFGHGGVDVLEEVEIPCPEPKDHEVLVRLQAASLNHLDIHVRRGIPGLNINLPHIPGSDGAGIVAELGKHCASLKKGDRVLIKPGSSCGSCQVCVRGQETLCHRYRILGEHAWGTYAEYIALPENQVLALPSDIDMTTAAACALTYMTAWSMVVSKGQVCLGQNVLVMGAGSGVSIAAIQIAKMLGARVFTTASTPVKRNKALDVLAVDEVIDYTQAPIDQACRHLTGKQGVDVVIDHVGGEQWLPILRATRNGGKIITCGATAGYHPQQDLRQIFFRQLQILGSTMATDAELHQVLDLIFAKKLIPVIDSHFDLAHAAQAQQRMEGRQSFGKIVLTI